MIVVDWDWCPWCCAIWSSGGPESDPDRQTEGGDESPGPQTPQTDVGGSAVSPGRWRVRLVIPTTVRQVDKRDITTVRCLMGCSLSRMGRRSQELLTFSCIFYLLAILASASAKSNTWQNVMHMGGGMVWRIIVFVCVVGSEVFLVILLCEFNNF